MSTALTPYALEQRSPHNRVLVAIMCYFFGIFGVHRFMVGKWGTGLLQLFTLGGFGIWTTIDFIIILLGRFRDDQNRVLGPPQIAYREPVRRLPAPVRPVQPKAPEFEDPLENDPLEEEFAQLERQLKDRRGADGSL